MPRRADISDTDYRALAEFRHHIRRFLRFSEDAARAAGLEPQQHQLLLAIRGLPQGTEPSIGELAERLHSSITASSNCSTVLKDAAWRGASAALPTDGWCWRV